MTHKQVERYKCIDAEPDCVKRFTRTSLRQANGAIIKEKISMTRKNPKKSPPQKTLTLKLILLKQLSVTQNSKINNFNHDSKSKSKQTPTQNTTNTVLLPSHFAFAVFDEDTGKMMEMRDLLNHSNPEIRKIWITAVSNEYGRLMKGV